LTGCPAKGEMRVPTGPVAGAPFWPVKIIRGSRAAARPGWLHRPNRSWLACLSPARSEDQQYNRGAIPH
jgi:hypothetical protein